MHFSYQNPVTGLIWHKQCTNCQISCAMELVKATPNYPIPIVHRPNCSCIILNTACSGLTDWSYQYLDISTLAPFPYLFRYPPTCLAVYSIFHEERLTFDSEFGNLFSTCCYLELKCDQTDARMLSYHVRSLQHIIRSLVLFSLKIYYTL